MAFCLLRGGSQPQRGTFSSSGPTAPTSVYIAEKGDPIVGAKAKRAAVLAPELLFENFKTAIFEAPDKSHKNGPTPVELTALLILFTIKEATKCDPELEGYFDGSKPREELCIAFTGPAQFTAIEWTWYDRAAELAGIKIDVRVSESVAAVISSGAEFTSTVSNGDKIATIDIGGGTTDITIIEFSDGVYNELVTNRGLSNVAGTAFTAVLARLIGTKMRVKNVSCFDECLGLDLGESNLPKKKRQKMLKIWRSAQQAKHELSVEPETVAAIELNGNLVEAEVSQSEFKVASKGILNRIASAVEKAPEGSGVTWNDIDHVILAGGAASTFGLREVVADATGRMAEKVLINSDRTHAIVNGAAIKAYAGEASAAGCAGGIAIKVRCPASGDYMLKWLHGSGAAVGKDGVEIAQSGQLYIGTGHESDYRLSIYQAKAGVTKIVEDGDAVIGPMTEGLRLAGYSFRRVLPPGEHNVDFRLYVESSGRIQLTVQFPGVPVEPATVVLKGDLNSRDDLDAQQQTIRVIVVLDCSKSMEVDGKMKQAIDGSLKLFQRYANSKHVEFGLVTFGDKAKLLAPIGTKTAELQTAARSVQPIGGTPMADAFRIAQSEFAKQNGVARKLVVVVSDGCPNDHDQAAIAADSLKKTAEIFALGIGSDVDQRFLTRATTIPQNYRFANANEVADMLETILDPILTHNHSSLLASKEREAANGNA